MPRLPIAASVLAVAFAAPAARAQAADPTWIWGHFADTLERPNGEACAFRHGLELPAAPKKLVAWVAADNHVRLFVNGAAVARCDDWSHPVKVDLTAKVRVGANVLVAACSNDGAPAGFLFVAELTKADGKVERLMSDASWASRGIAALDDAAALAESAPTDTGNAAWKPAHEIGRLGCPPWGRVAMAGGGPTPFDTLPGFRVQPLAEGIGSLIAMTVAGPGRYFVSVESGGILELDDANGDGEAETIAPFTDELHVCQGLLWFDDALLATAEGPKGTGLYRIPKAGAPPELLGRFNGEMGEHGPHAIVPGPDGRLYLAIGNHSAVGEPIAADSPYRITYEGHLLPRYVDPRGHATHCLAPGGVVARYDPRTGAWDHFAAGFRNHYDVAFTASGELITFDSDMEWDVGLPWYRPIRLVHVVAGGEYGWRTGSTTWPDFYEDSLPPIADSGRGSPTGVCRCTSTRFPGRFRDAILCGDWSQGVIRAYKLESSGATFRSTDEVLLRGRPLNVTDLESAPDGSVVFTLGGRGTHGGIYRLIYDGPNDPGPSIFARPVPPAPANTVAGRIAELGDADRFVRFSAGRALERQPRGTWSAAALAAPSALARGEALIALARAGMDDATADEVRAWIEAAAAIALAPMPTPAGATKPDASIRRTALRALELALIRWDALLVAANPPPPAAAPKTGDAKPPRTPKGLTASAAPRALPPWLAPLAQKLLGTFPCNDAGADRELAELIGYLAPDGAAAKLVAALGSEPSRIQRIWYAYCARAIRTGWSSADRLAVARFTDLATREWSGGLSFDGYLADIRTDLEPLLTAEERATLAKEQADAAAATTSAAPTVAAGAPRNLDTTLTVVERTLADPRRSRDEGARVYEALCAKCHKHGERGAAVGPELTTVGARLNLHDLLEAILVPSQSIPDQYRALNVFLKGGDIESGLAVVDDARHLVLFQSDGKKKEIAADRIESRRPATKSLMPDGLADGLTTEEVADLCAFLQSDRPANANAAPLWRPLFDGKSLANFRGADGAWSVVDGALVGHGRGEATALVASEPLADFIVEFDLRVLATQQEAGFQFRSKETAPFRLAGPQAHAGKRGWGGLYDEGGRGLLQQIANELVDTLPDRRDFNHYVVSAIGPRLTIELNGTVTVDARDAAAPREGLIGFALLAGASGDVTIRNVRVRTTGLLSQ